MGNAISIVQDLDRGWKSWKLADESRLSKLQNSLDRPEYYPETYNSDSSEKHLLTQNNASLSHQFFSLSDSKSRQVSRTLLSILLLIPFNSFSIDHLIKYTTQSDILNIFRHPVIQIRRPISFFFLEYHRMAQFFLFLFTTLRMWWSIYNRTLRLMSRVFTNGPGDRGSIPGQVIPKT